MREVMRSISSRWRLAVVVAVTLTALVAGVLLVRAEPVPRTFTYQGVLTDAGGTPISGDHTITVRVYADDTTGTPLCTEIEVATLVNGLFRVTVGDGGCTVDAGWFALTAPVYLGITVDTTLLSPRVPLFPVASAYQAEHAESAERLVVHYGGEEISVGGIYCGSSIAMTGNAGGYAGVKALCETACGDPAAHVCSIEEVGRSVQLGIVVPNNARYTAAHQFSVGGNANTDCSGWKETTSGFSSILSYYTSDPSLPQPWNEGCGVSIPFLCCL